MNNIIQYFQIKEKI